MSWITKALQAWGGVPEVIEAIQGGEAAVKETKNMAVTIPPIPDGVVNPANLYNEGYADLVPLTWADEVFHDKIAWLNENQPFVIRQWYATRNVSPETAFLLPTQFTAVFPNGNTFEVDCRNVVINPELLLYVFQGMAGAKKSNAAYPGYEARHPAEGGNPIGPALAVQPWAGRTLYEDLKPEAYAVGKVLPQENGDKFTKIMYVKVTGGGPFGTGAKYGTAWEKTYSGK
jgi:hypothetical protein